MFITPRVVKMSISKTDPPLSSRMTVGPIDTRGGDLQNSRSVAEEPREGAFQHVHAGQARSQRIGYARLAPIRSSQLPADRARGVGVVAQVDRPQDGLLECAGIVERPQGSFQA